MQRISVAYCPQKSLPGRADICISLQMHILQSLLGSHCSLSRGHFLFIATFVNVMISIRQKLLPLRSTTRNAARFPAARKVGFDVVFTLAGANAALLQSTAGNVIAVARKAAPFLHNWQLRYWLAKKQILFEKTRFCSNQFLLHLGAARTTTCHACSLELCGYFLASEN